MGFAFRSLLLGACVAIAVPASARDFRSADVHPADYPTVEAVKHMGKLLARADRAASWACKVYPNGALGTEKDNIEQLRIGGLDMMRINVAPLNSVVPETIVTALPFVFRSERAHAQGARRPGRRRDPRLDGVAGPGRARLLRQRRALLLHREEADQDAGRHEGHEDPRAAVGPLRGDDRGARRQPDADALRRGLHGAQDRHRRRRREQLAVLRVLAPLRGGEVLQP